MIDDRDGDEPFDDDIVALALAASAARLDPSPDVRRRLMARLEPAPPAGFAIYRANDEGWMPHPVPGIRMKVLALNRRRGYAVLLLDVAPGTRFPAHHHDAAEECYVLSGSLHTCDRRLGPGDFVHADSGTDHAELWTEEGCRVLIVGPVDEHLS